MKGANVTPSVAHLRPISMHPRTSWKVVFKKTNGQHLILSMPAGLSEPEALRNATLKAPLHATFVRIYREDPRQVGGQFDRTLDSILRSA